MWLWGHICHIPNERGGENNSDNNSNEMKIKKEKNIYKNKTKRKK